MAENKLTKFNVITYKKTHIESLNFTLNESRGYRNHKKYFHAQFTLILEVKSKNTPLLG